MKKCTTVGQVACLQAPPGKEGAGNGEHLVEGVPPGSPNPDPRPKNVIFHIHFQTWR